VSDVRLPRPTVRDDFRKRLRADLINEAAALAEERRSRGSSRLARIASWWSAGRLRPIAAAATLVALLVAGAGTAAAGSVPGDPAFALKAAAEQVELALAPTDVDRVQVLASHAQHRLDDLARTSDRPEKAPTASAAYEAAVQRFAAAVQALRNAAPGAKRDAVEQVVEAAHDKHLEVLRDLQERLPEPAQENIERAIEEHQKLTPGRPEHPRASERPGAAPSRPGDTERPRPTPTARPTETPRATETSRSGRATPTPTAR
jgi:hypothetical protein